MKHLTHLIEWVADTIQRGGVRAVVLVLLICGAVSLIVGQCDRPAPPPKPMILRDANGNIIRVIGPATVEIDGKRYTMKPGEVWEP